MNKNLTHTINTTPPPTILPVMQKIKSVYIVWFEYYQKLDKTHKYTLGKRIDDLFIETIEAVAVATFLDRTEKQPWIKFAIRKLDTIKILLMILWETKSIDNKKYIHISKPIEEIGKMLGGWNGQLTKQNSLK